MFPFLKRTFNMKQTTALKLLIFVFISLVIAPGIAFGWGAGMHATLTAHGHDRMTARWKDALDRGLLIYGSFGPDVWYIQKIGEEAELACPVACGSDDGRISNECWGDISKGADRYFAYARQLMVNADSLAAVSWAFGYAAHAVEDWRGHKEYIMPGWRNPGSGNKNRHTLVDSSGSALAFNYQGYQGYPSTYTMDRTTYGYVNGGFVNADNAHATGERNPHVGLGLDIRTNTSGRLIHWDGVLDEATTGLSVETIRYMGDNASLGSASEGILAALYGITGRYDSLGNDWPIVTANREVAIDCGTNYSQRMISEEGVGYPFACQIYHASLLSGVIYGAKKPAIWFNYLKPADDTSDQIIVNDEMVELWMDRFVNHFEWEDGVRLDDTAVFGINPETGKSELRLIGVEGRDFTFGKTLPEIVSDVLEQSVIDLVERVYEQPALLGAVLQSRLNPVDKARFVSFGFHYRPRLSAWPETLDYQEESIRLIPSAPGALNQVDISVDVSADELNAAPTMVFPYYVVTLRIETESAQGTGQLVGQIAYRDDSGEPLEEPLANFALDLDGATLTDPESVALVELTDSVDYTVRVLLDNTTGGWYFYNPEALRAALALRLSLEITDGSQPPFDYIIDSSIQPYCTRPDLSAPGEPSQDASNCPLDVPDFPEPDGDTDSDSDLEMDLEEETVPDGDSDQETVIKDGDIEDDNVIEDGDLTPDGDTDLDPVTEGSSGGCAQTQASTSGLLLLLGLALLAFRRRAETR
jgi:hypothetical protein